MSAPRVVITDQVFPDVEVERQILAPIGAEIEVADGTRLTVVESGFDAIPLARRLEAYRGNEQGWTAQMEAIERYVTQTA